MGNIVATGGGLPSLPGGAGGAASAAGKIAGAAKATAGAQIFGAAAKIVGGGLEGLGYAVGGAIQGASTIIGSTIQAAGSALGGALQGMFTPAPVTIINSFGMVGSAGKIKAVTGSLPPLSTAPKLAISEKTHPNVLMSMAVNYLASIDTTLKDQNKLQHYIFNAERQAYRESVIENNQINNLGESFGAKIENKGKDENRGKSLAKSAADALKNTLLGGAALYLLQFNNSDIEAMKDALTTFEQKYKPFFEIGAILGQVSFAVFAGNLVKTGLSMIAKGGAIGAVAKAAPMVAGGAGLLLASDNVGSLGETVTGSKTAGAWTSALSSAVSGGMIGGGLGLGIGSLPGWAIGSIAGLGYGLYNNWDNLWGSDDATKVAGSTPAGTPAQASSFVPTGEAKVDQATKYFMDKLGISQYQAAGIVANLYYESGGLNTNAFNGAGGGQGAYGLAQWRGSRLDGLRAFAASRGKREDDFETQLAWVVQELNTTHKDALSAIRSSKTSDQATLAMLDKFEKPGAHDRLKSMQNRFALGMAIEKGTNLKTSQSDYKDPASRLASAQSPMSQGVEDTLLMVARVSSKIRDIIKSDSISKGASLVTAAPDYSTYNKASTIQEEQKSLESQYLSGLKRQRDKGETMISSMTPADQLRMISGVGITDAIDPNYKPTSGPLEQYLMYFGLIKAA